MGGLSSIGTNVFPAGITITGGSITSPAAADVNIVPGAGGITVIGDAGATGHSLAANDDLFVSGNMEVDGTVYFDGLVDCWFGIRARDNIIFRLGTGNDSYLMYGTAQTNDAVMWGLSTDSKSIIFCDVGDTTTDFAHAAASNPTIFLQASDAIDVTKWGSLSRDDNDFVIAVGAGGNGDLFLSPDGVVKFGTHTAIGAETVTGYITIKDAAGNSRKLAVVS